VSPPSTLSPIGGKIQEVEISTAAKSRGPNSNAYAERSLLTQGGST